MSNERRGGDGRVREERQRIEIRNSRFEIREQSRLTSMLGPPARPQSSPRSSLSSIHIASTTANLLWALSTLLSIKLSPPILPSSPTSPREITSARRPAATSGDMRLPRDGTLYVQNQKKRGEGEEERIQVADVMNR